MIIKSNTFSEGNNKIPNTRETVKKDNYTNQSMKLANPRSNNYKYSNYSNGPDMVQAFKK